MADDSDTRNRLSRICGGDAACFLADGVFL